MGFLLFECHLLPAGLLVETRLQVPNSTYSRRISSRDNQVYERKEAQPTTQCLHTTVGAEDLQLRPTADLANACPSIPEPGIRDEAPAFRGTKGRACGLDVYVTVIQCPAAAATPQLQAHAIESALHPFITQLRVGRSTHGTCQRCRSPFFIGLPAQYGLLGLHGARAHLPITGRSCF